MTEKYLTWHVKRNPVLSGDWFWLKSKFLPAIKNVEHDKKNAELVSLCYYMVGDVFDFQDAPREAIKYYKLAIKYCKKHASVYREIGYMLTRIKKYDLAFQYLNKAYALDASDLCIQEDLSFLKEKMRQIKKKSIPIKECVYEKCSELLAQGQATKVLKKINKSQCVMDHQFRARAHGILRDKKPFIKEWESMLVYDEKIEPHSADWFYMPKNVWNDFRFWNVLYQMREKFTPGVYPYPDNFGKQINNASASNYDVAGTIILCNKKFELFIQHQMKKLRNKNEDS